MAALRVLARASRSVSTPSRVVQRASQFSLSKRVLIRELHQTPVALKRKFAVSEGYDDLKSDDDGDMFGDGASESSSDALDVKVPTSKRNGVRRKLSITEREARFHKDLEFLSSRIGLNPRMKTPQPRHTAWQHLFQLAATREQMEQVVDLFPLWRDSKKEFTPVMAEGFVARCEELRCPDLALQVFSDHPRYGFDLSSSKAARHLLHSLHLEHELSKSITLVALFKLYELPMVTQDLVACSLLTVACLRANNKKATVVANSLVPELKKLLETKNPGDWMVPKPKTPARTTLEGKEKSWLAWTLVKVERALEEKGENVGWLRDWRKEAGHFRVVGPAIGLR